MENPTTQRHLQSHFGIVDRWQEYAWRVVHIDVGFGMHLGGRDAFGDAWDPTHYRTFIYIAISPRDYYGGNRCFSSGYSE